MATKSKTLKPLANTSEALIVVSPLVAIKPRAVPKVQSTEPAPPPIRTKPSVVPTLPVSSFSKGAATVTNALTKKDLIDEIVISTGAKKNLVRDIVEATLGILGDALSKGTMLNLPPLGKAKVSRPSDDPGRAMTVKLRRNPGGGQGAFTAKQSLADAED